MNIYEALRSHLANGFEHFHFPSLSSESPGDIWRHLRTFVDMLDQHFRNAVGRMAQEAGDEHR